MEDSKKTTIIAAPAAAGQAAGTTEQLAAAIAGAGGAVVSTVVLKPGWKTSELWLSVCLPALCHLLTVVSNIPGPWGILAGALGAGLYSLSRGMAKK